mgnify:CR=1 FL=1
MGIRKLYSVEIELAVRGGIRSESFIRLKSKVTDALNESKESTDFRMFSHLPMAMKLYIVKNIMLIYMLRYLMQLKNYLWKLKIWTSKKIEREKYI